MLLSFAQWIELTDFFTAFRGSWFVYPIVLSLHMIGIAFFGGMVLMTDMRMLGWSMRKHSIADVVEQFRVPKRYGLLLMVICGVLMAGAKAEEYYYNVFFRAKLILLALLVVHALTFRKSVYADPAALDRTPVIPRNAKVAAALSLLLWTSVACCGRGIGYIEPPLEKIHAGLHLVQEAALTPLHLPPKPRPRMR
jgi:uncharacterized protein DUF6644